MEKVRAGRVRLTKPIKSVRQGSFFSLLGACLPLAAQDKDSPEPLTSTNVLKRVQVGVRNRAKPNPFSIDTIDKPNPFGKSADDANLFETTRKNPLEVKATPFDESARHQRECGERLVGISNSRTSSETKGYR